MKHNTFLMAAKISVALGLFHLFLATARPLNILLLLADDLGYGDLSVAPFTGTGAKTPNLETMARNGLTMTNFHSAAPICSPSRAAILTGLFSFRVGVAGIYEAGKPDGLSNRNDWLNKMPTSAMVFRDAGYYTAHVGKWHLGGMRPNDLQERNLTANTQCSHPGPNQLGFDEYVSMTEGTWKLLVKGGGTTFHTEGGKYQLRNDQPWPCSGEDTLNNCEAKDAIRIMQSAHASDTPFFLQVWFETPHGKGGHCVIEYD